MALGRNRGVAVFEGLAENEATPQILPKRVNPLFLPKCAKTPRFLPIFMQVD